MLCQLPPHFTSHGAVPQCRGRYQPTGGGGSRGGARGPSHAALHAPSSLRATLATSARPERFSNERRYTQQLSWVRYERQQFTHGRVEAACGPFAQSKFQPGKGPA